MSIKPILFSAELLKGGHLMMMFTQEHLSIANNTDQSSEIKKLPTRQKMLKTI